jgi:hypothetical protein
MMQSLDLIQTTAEKHIGYFQQLNAARNGLKHTGNLPNTSQWASVADDVLDKLSSICEATLQVSLDAVDESELLRDNDTKAYLQAAKRARDSGDFKLALEEIARALCTSFLNMPGTMFNVGCPKAEDALKLTAFGVPANDFLRLQEFLPAMCDYPSTESNRVNAPDISWKQNGFGHPGNWRKEVVDFCLSACLDVALRIQNAPEIPYAIPFEYEYDYKVTAIKDNVEVWDDLIEEQLEQIPPFDENEPNVRPFRESKRRLAKGESIILSGKTRPLVSNDRALDGRPIKRLQVSTNDLQGIYPHGKAEFVNLEQVQIICVPKGSGSLPDIPYEEDDPLS